jgi:hypothetical protein
MREDFRGLIADGVSAAEATDPLIARYEMVCLRTRIPT